VLINRTHTDTDLFFPIDVTQKRLFDSIDGNRNISKILKKTSMRDDQQREVARTFFEQLWWWDQVVFDTSARWADTVNP
jgi:hypothetical protein